MKRETIKFILLIFFAAAAFFAVKYLSLDKLLFSGDVALWVEGFGPWAPLIYVSVYAIAPSFMFPGVPLTVLGGALFGPLWGIIYASIGATLGASVAFLEQQRLFQCVIVLLVGDQPQEGAIQRRPTCANLQFLDEIGDKLDQNGDIHLSLL